MPKGRGYTNSSKMKKPASLAVNPSKKKKKKSKARKAPGSIRPGAY